MNLKSKLKLIGINLLLFVLLFGLIYFNKVFLRPNFNHMPLVNFLTGSFPNFISAYLISLCIVNPILVKKPKYEKSIVYIGSFLVFVILAFEEFVPMWGARTQFDLFDVVASGFGSLSAILTFEFILKGKKKELIEF